MPILTPEMFENLHRDFIDTGKAINIIGIISPRYGEPFKSLPLVSKEAENRGGYIGAPTLTALQAIVPSYNWQLARDDSTGDEYRWNPAASPDPKWEPTGRNYLKDAKSFAENAVVSAPKGIKQFGYYTGTSTTTLLSQDGPQAYAVQVKDSGFIKKIKTQLAGGPSKVRIQVYRPSDKGATLMETRVYDVSYPLSEISLIDNPIHVEKNDLVTLAWISGTYIRGKIVASGDPLGSFVVTQTLNVGEQVAISRSRNTLEFMIDLLVDEKSQVNVVDSLNGLGIGYSVKDSLINTVVGALNTPTTSGDTTWAYGEITSPTKLSKLKQIRYTTKSISRDVLFRLCILSPNKDGTYKIGTVKQVVAAADANGVVTATSANFGDILIPKGGYALISGTTTIDAPLAQATGLPNRPLPYINAALIQIGANVSLQVNPSTPPLSLEFTYELADKSLDERIAILEANSNKVDPPIYSTVLDSQNFDGTVLPSDWSAQGWTVNDGLFTPETGSWTAKALSTGSSALANREYSFDIEFVDATTTITGFCTDQIENEAGAGALLIDCTQNKLILYKYNGTQAGTLMVETEIDPIVVNQKYRVVIRKNGYFSTFLLINKTTGATSTLEYSDTTPGRYVQMHGRAGFLHIQGQAKYTNYSFIAFYKKDVHAILVTDSNGERAANVLPNQAWPYQLAEIRRMNADTIMAGRSGDETTNFLKRKQYDLMVWKPKYIVWALGTNDLSQETWRKNMEQNIADTLALGAIPILCTQVPRGFNSDVNFLMDEDIRNYHFGPYKYVDFSKAVSLNNDGRTWNPAYNSGDNLHVNPAGQERFLQQLKIDAPELFR